MEISLFRIFFSIFFLFIPICLFHLQEYIAPNTERRKYRTRLMNLFTVLSIVLSWGFGTLQYTHIWNATLYSFEFILATILLFIGPIVQSIMRNQKHKKTLKQVLTNNINRFKTSYGFLSIIIGPITEEILYRAFLCGIWAGENISPKKIIWISPFAFSFSHFHHYFDDKDENTPKERFFSALFQCFYTLLFAFWECFCWCVTHNIIACILLHSFCNYMGFPDIGRLPRDPLIVKITYVLGIVIFILLTIHLSHFLPEI